ncbi:MAG: DUF2058 domain-containing protein [Methylococcaceae bacterium]
MSKKLSLQEQLLKSGLVSNAQAKTVKSQKHKQQQLQRKNNVVIVDEAKLLAQQAQAEKIAKDRELNQLRQQQEQQKQIIAQIKQLIHEHKQKTDDNGVAYNFNDNNKVKTLYLSETMRDSVIRGRLAIVRDENHYAVVSQEAAQKIAQRDASYVVVDNSKASETISSDDPYAAYAIPDDLMW